MREYKISEVCRELARLERRGVAYTKIHIYRLIKNGKLQTVQNKKPVRVSEKALHDYLKNKQKYLHTQHDVLPKIDNRSARHFKNY